MIQAIKIYFVYIVLMLLVGCQAYKFKRTPIPQETSIKSIVLTGYGINSYSIKGVDSYISALKEINANMASLLITCHTDNINSSKVNCDSNDTPSDYEIKRAAQKIKESNLMLSLRVYIDLKDREWRCLWNPTDKTEAMSEIDRVLTRYSKLAETLKAELFIIGAEYCKLTTSTFTKNWNRTITNIRTHFKGRVTYGANWSLPNSSISEFNQIGFWENLDYIGIDHYWGLPAKTKVSEKAIAGHHREVAKKFLQFSKREKKELILTEVGIPIEHSGVFRPWRWDLKEKRSEWRQQVSYSQMLNSFYKYPEFKGLFIWRFSPSDFIEEDSSPAGYNLYSTKAWSAIKSFWSNK